MSAILGILGPILKWAVGWWTAKNSAQVVQRAEAQNIQLNTDNIRLLIHQYHFGATKEKRDAALEDLRRMGAMT
jgi:hypothetical protein